MSILERQRIQQICKGNLYNLRKYKTHIIVDVLNPKVIEKFIEVTHEEYLKDFRTLLEAVYRIFTDEPQFAKLKIPYSICLPGEFQRENGRNLLQALFRRLELQKNTDMISGRRYQDVYRRLL